MKTEKRNAKPTEQEYLYKIEIEMDDEKILADQECDINKIYDAIRAWYAEENIKEIPNDRGILIFACSDTNEKVDTKLARFIVVEETLLKQDWFVKYVKKMTWFDKIYGDVSEEDMLEAFHRHGLI